MGRDAFNRSPAPPLSLSSLPKGVAEVTARPARPRQGPKLALKTPGGPLPAGRPYLGKEGGTEVPNSTPY